MTASRFNLVTLFALFALFLGTEAGWAAKPLTGIGAIRNLNIKKAADGRSVQVEGQIMWLQPYNETLFLYDGTSAVFVRNNGASDVFNTLKAGDLIQVKGVTTEGGFAPDIVAEKITVIGNEPRPEPVLFYNVLLFSPLADCKWVKTDGRLISMTTLWDSQSIVVEVNRNNTVLNLMVPYTEYNEKRLTNMMYEYVVIKAVSGTVFNNRRQAVGQIFYVNSADDIHLGESAHRNPEASVVPIGQLFSYKQNPRTVVKTHGVVTHVDSSELILRGEGASLKVAVSSMPGNISEGDEVELAGLVWPQPVSPAFRAQTIKVISKQEVPQPVRVEPGVEIGVDLNYELIELDAELVELGQGFVGGSGVRQPRLLCRFSGEVFEVLFPTSTTLHEDLRPGARLRLTGICHVKRNPNITWYLKLDGFSLKLRSENDAVILMKAPWWTIRRLLWTLGIVCSAMILFVVWVGILNRTVRQQTDIIRDKVERESIMNERQRIARELHDNLIQGLVGMGILLKGCLRRMELNKDKICERIKEGKLSDQRLTPMLDEVEQAIAAERESLTDLREMIDRCSEESRSSILYLRSGMAGRMGLVSTLQEVLEPLAVESNITLYVFLEGQARALKQEIERNLMLTTKEAVTNAIRHSGTERVDVVLHYTESGLEICVKDSGCGFDVEHIQKRGHYGLVGMKERIKQLDGFLDVRSIVGNGTQVMILLESTAEWEV